MNYKTIILASSRDLRRCPLTSSLATCLWPVVGAPVVERLLSGLSAQGVSEAVVCSNGCGAVIERTIDKTKCPDLTFMDEPFPVGSAGCIRDAVNGDADDVRGGLLVVFQGSMVSPPRIDELLKAHKEGGSDLTVFFEPKEQTAGSKKQAAENEQVAGSKKQTAENEQVAGSKQQGAENEQVAGSKKQGAKSSEQTAGSKQQTAENEQVAGSNEQLAKGKEKLPADCCLLSARRSRQGEGAGIYVCNSSVLEHIPAIGYFDIKESLIPALLAADKKIYHATLPGNVNNFRNRREYLVAAANAFNGLDANGLEKFNGLDDVWIGKDVEIAADARIVGPVAVLDGAKIERGAVVLGPAVIGRNSVVGTGSVVVNSILWDRASVGSGCHISDSVVAANTTVEDDAVLADTAVAVKGGGVLERIMRKICQRPEAG
ncbi:MAG: NDP-sugar synthase [Planctomycetes bacterium]|nr:NDP-sugar synthase [Planctomycetota bacterium]